LRGARNFVIIPASKKGKVMKKLLFCSVLAVLCCVGTARAAQNITIYYSPSCPHCHHAMDFIDKTLSGEYKNLEVIKINVMEQGNRDKFIAAVKKCDFQSGGVPVIIANEKCFQGYAQFMNTEIMAALGSADVGADAQATESKPDVATLPEEQIAPAKKSSGTATMLYVLLGLLVIALGVVLFGKRKK
jgi:LPXTG-motif cell wall-anchored protein